MRLRPHLVLVILTIAALAATRPALAQCPASHVHCVDIESREYVTDPVFERMCSTAPEMRISQNAIEGRIAVRKSGPGSFASDVWWIDEFVVRNASSGEIEVTARLSLNGWIDSPPGSVPGEDGVGNVIFGVQQGTGGGESIWLEREPGSGRYDIPAGTHVVSSSRVEVDRSFVLIAYLAGIGLLTGEVDAEAQLVFEGLPEGAWIESCKGFRQPVAVPAQMVSWGRFKAIYR